MAIKTVNEIKPNQLLGVIKREYSFINILLFIISILSLGSCGELWKQPEEGKRFFGNAYDSLQPGKIPLVIFFILIFCIASFPFVKSALAQIKNITFPSFKKIAVNTLQVICFTFFLILCIYYFGVIIKLSHEFFKK
ncbi:preprotein translocase subunit SecE ['Fragaria x ananassa' phyllody phytoplasma]|uniref:Preprotein translocase subunit SecE n=1 Tax='Fragaria x ananassa' phyllody phytoplasma TaxID=2358428 RepID=A0ABS5K371_9MOLU|nr:preprotein translocase subunit SecE ['Fragaria x ananassa' phyllody phytoplasma]MBS2126353.1 preprotein translocase subunit SecE ['Fragaria x ananassa' phyllody phytoplasma]